MNKKEFETKVELINETFNDKRKFKCIPPEEKLELNEKIAQNEDIFKTESGEYIYIDVQIKDFTVDSLVDYIEIAEEIYETFKRHVSIYIICSNNVNVFVKEDEIKSDADFTIKLAKVGYDPAEAVLRIIKQKIDNNERLDTTDLDMLKNLPMMCNRKMRRHYRKESLKIINENYF